jgi:hypothetical protein
MILLNNLEGNIMVWLWVLIIHVIEIVVIGLFFLIRRNNILEKAVNDQQQYIDAISIVIANSDARLRELDTMGAFEADDEVGTFFQNLREIQTTISQFNNRK